LSCSLCTAGQKFINTKIDLTCQRSTCRGHSLGSSWKTLEDNFISGHFLGGQGGGHFRAKVNIYIQAFSTSSVSNILETDRH
ncbi:hypothetical protein BgiBS90_019367, partial [Biomphalaria glabrata]